MPQVTLKDIARALGVTTTTVHRALQGKEGVSDATRQRVQRMAAQMGYRTNYMAAALKRKEVRIAIALPDPVDDNRFFYGNMWLGVRRLLSEVSQDFNVVPLEYTYPLVYAANGNALKTIYDNHIDALDGLFTMGVDHNQSSYYIQRFSEKGIPIVFVGSDMYKDLRFCCVKSCDEMAGSLAAELLSTFTLDKSPRKVVVVGHFGQLGMNDQLYNVMGFDTYIKENAPHIHTLHIHNENHQVVCMELKQLLQSDPDISAIYSSSARYTVYVSQTLEELGLAGKLTVVGNDCFQESLHLLQQGTLTAIIDKRISHQSYLATKTLFDHIVKGDYPISSVLQLRPEVVLRSNLKKDFTVGTLHDSPGQEASYDEVVYG